MRFSRRLSILFVGLVGLATLFVAGSLARPVSGPPIRIAVIGFNGNRAAAIAASVAEVLRRDRRVAVLDAAEWRPAVVATGYGGSINLSLSDARGLGAAAGCDFFIVGKAETLARSDRVNETHFESFAAVMIVDGRGGSLAHFDFIQRRAGDSPVADAEVLHAIAERAPSWVEQLIGLSSSRERAAPPANTLPVAGVEEMPAAGSAAAAGFTPPEFEPRIKPQYTAEAELADVSATFEAMVEFRADGTIGAIDVTRWCGFGLDDAAKAAISALRFKPARREGVPIGVRGLVQYNFRRVNDTEPPRDERQR